MKYTNESGSTYPYPENNIDPSKKDGEWCMAYAKAAWNDWNFSYPKGVFYNNNGDYQKYRLYALGKQPITQYKKQLGVDDQTNNTWLSVDWSVRNIISGYRDKAISRLMKQTHGIVATPIDMTAKAELDTYYAEMKSKLAIKQLMEQTNQELANHPLISLESGDPMDIEELEMRVELGEQFNRAKDAEQAIQLGFYENGIDHFRRTLYEDLFDYGVGGYKEWLGDDNHAKFRKVNPENVIINFCRQSDFRDLVHAGEVIDVSLTDLALVKNEDGTQRFTDAELEEFAGSIAGKFGNPMSMGRGFAWYKPYDKFKCKVLDIEFFSYNEYNYRDVTDENGNVDFRKADYNRGKKAVEKYTRKKLQVVYKVKWIVGTDKFYDYGLCNDMKRSPNPKKKAYTKLSYKFYAYDFYEMKASGMMERCVPYIDDYQLTMLKIQNFKNRAVPSGWWIDMDALENIALNKGGKNMEPKELLQMFFETGVLLGRSKDESGNPMSPNWKPVIPIQNTAASELAMFYQDLISTIQAIEKITGYNPVTAGEANPKMLVPGYESANISTDDALYPMAFSEQQLSIGLAEDVLCRMQQGVKKGEVTGYAPYTNALNVNTLAFIKVSPSIALREYGIMLQEKTSDDQKAWLFQQMQGDIVNGYLDSSDAIMLLNTHNAKACQLLWAYKVKKSKQAIQQQEMAKIQEANNGALQNSQLTHQQNMEKLQAEIQGKYMIEQLKIQGELEKEKIRFAKENQVANTNVQGKILTQTVANEGKAQSQLNQ